MHLARPLLTVEAHQSNTRPINPTPCLTLAPWTSRMPCSSESFTNGAKERDHTMKTFGSLGCALLLLSMLGILSCNNASYVRKGAEVKTNTVTITDCVASPDTVQINLNDTLTWLNDSSDKNQYTIHFERTPLPANDAPTGQGQKVKGDFWCNHLHSIHADYCVYPYDLIKADGKKCPDPGVHVTP